MDAHEQEPVFGAIEAGGTKFRVAVASGRRLLSDTTIPTTSPSETLAAAVAFLAAAPQDLAGVGIASFGPVDLDTASTTYGHIAATPKPGWSGTDIAGYVGKELGVPVAIDVDVNGAALAEGLWGAARGLDSFVYLTVGTGVGGGLYVGGRPHHGLGHPEMGHMVVSREPSDDFAGRCPFHGGCLEGMACGPAISDRWNTPIRQLHSRPEVWQLEARYLAQALRNLTYVVAPQRVLLGGGVMQREGLIELVRDQLSVELNGYSSSAQMLRPLDNFVVAPKLGQDAGLYGAAALAASALGT